MSSSAVSNLRIVFSSFFFDWRFQQKTIEVFAQLQHRRIEVLDVAKGARLHNATLHCREHELRESTPVQVRRQLRFGFEQTLFDGIDPSLKVLCQSLSNRGIRLVQFQCQAADGASVATLGIEQRFAISRKQREYSLNGVVNSGPCWIEQHWSNAVVVHVE